MSQPLVIISCVGLTPRHLGADTPNLSALAGAGFVAPLSGPIPAVTTTAQATLVTGVGPESHGIVGNGWYFRELGEVWFWRQSERLIQAESCWSRLRRTRKDLRVLKHFWWYAMNTDVDATVTPRPVYHHDGRKSPDFYALPATLKAAIQAKHGTFPLFSFWGPTANVTSTRWIAESFATAFAATRPHLSWVYLPHLDYDLQRFGPRGPHLAKSLRQLDAEAGKVIATAKEHGALPIVVSEYGLEAVDHAVEINRALRRNGLLAVTRNAAGELLDPGASRAFAVCDHQVAHVYCQQPEDVGRTLEVLARVPGISQTFAGRERREIGLDHPRSGEIIAIAERGAWFAYDYWLEDEARPDFARCVEIHKKPGYDPRELFFDPKGGKRRAMTALARKMLGLRYRMDPCPLDTSLVRGSHGLPASDPQDGAVLICPDATWAKATQSAWDMRDLAPAIERHLG